MRKDPWNPQRTFPWNAIKSKWEEVWDCSKPILLEKSPPNIIRAFEIEKVFSPAYFIAMIRNPYAFCEGFSRRNSTSMEDAAKFWVKCAEYQIKNIQGLNKIIYFTYEMLTEKPSKTSEQILHFVPQLERLNTNASFRVRSILGKKPEKITNFNEIKINQLSAKSILKINSVLKDHPHLMSFFGYEYIYPTNNHIIRYYKSVISLKVIQVLYYFNKIWTK